MERVTGSVRMSVSRVLEGERKRGFRRALARSPLNVSAELTKPRRAEGAAKNSTCYLRKLRNRLTPTPIQNHSLLASYHDSDVRPPKGKWFSL
ncbi:hypothetical protein FRC06_005824, partial [Ceratobasidium sp. 370]